jgi:D-amino-acid dehydrogenase
LSLALYHSPTERTALSGQAVAHAQLDNDSGAELAALYSRCIALEGFNDAEERLALATGAWAPSLARDLRLKVPIQPAKGYSITMPRPEGSPAVPLLLAEAKVGVTPLGDRLRLAGALELAGLDLSINERRVEAIRRGAASFLDGLESAGPGEVWRGLRPCTPDGLPILGRSSSFDNLILAAGHAMIGVSLGPVTGSLVARIACGEPTDIDLSALKPDRF